MDFLTATKIAQHGGDLANGALEGQGLEIGWLLSKSYRPVHDGSAVVLCILVMTIRCSILLAGKNNKAYVSIGRVLIERDLSPREKMSLKAIKEWALANDPEVVKELLEQNPSFVFFEARDDLSVMGSAGIPLLPMAAVAGDRSILPMGTPILAEVPLLNADGIEWCGTN